MFMDLKTQLETVAKNHQASIQNLETKFDGLADKKSGRPSGSLPSNTQPNPKGHNSKIYQPPQSRNEHVNVVFTRSAENMLVEVGKFTFPADFVILEMEEDNDDTCFSIDVIDEIIEEDFDALLNEGSKILHFIEGTLLEEEIFAEFDECMAITLFFPIIISSQLSKEKKNKLISVLKKHNQAFAWKTTDIPGICPSFCKHKIQLLDYKKPVVQKQRRLNPNMQEVVKKEIVKLLDTSIIYPIVDSPWVSPIYCVPKKGGITVVTNKNDELVPTRTITGWRVCIDYRKLKEATAKDHFPLPFMDQMLERLAGNKYFCFLNGFSRYFQIPINPNDQEKQHSRVLSAHTLIGSFGLCNAPATFQRCMLAIFHDVIKESVKVFMDDFSVFGNSFDTCLNNLDKMLQRCKDAHLVLNWEKCHFMVKKRIVLGHKVSSARLEVDKAKNQYFLKIARPITKQLEKDTLFEFDDECQKAFESLKEKLTCAHVIVSPNWNLPFELICDASDFAVGAILGQKDGKNFHPIYFASKTLNSAQQKYTVTEKELMAVFFAFDKFRSYLILSKTIAHTDHSALRHVFKKQDAKPRLIRWILLLQEFEIEIKDRKGTKNIAADHLSRLENNETSDDSEVDDNFSGETLMEINTKDEPWFADFANHLVGNIIPKGMTYQQKNNFFSDLKHYFWEEPTIFKVCSDGVIRRCKSGPETQTILDKCHHGPTCGHYGPNITAKKVLDLGFYWPTIIKEAHTLVCLCETCQKTGNISKRDEMPLNNIQVCKNFDIWGIDFMGPFPKSYKFEYILVVVDYVSKWAEAQTLPTNDARVVITFLKRLFCRFGMLKALISDRGTHFCNKIMEKTMKRYGVNHRFSTSYHPQTSGQVENTNRALKRILEKTVKDNPAIWSRKLDDALWAFRTAYKTPTGTTPYKLIYEKNCHLPFEIEHRAYWALKNCNLDLIAASEKRMFQLHELDELRYQTYENSRLYKERTKV
ncbi:putative nucleotidyltransferase, ribonuclease H [Tanacetum coccineum]